MAKRAYQRPILKDIFQGLAKKTNLIHVIIGPRQVGKTTAAIQLGDRWKKDHHGLVEYCSADQVLPPSSEWIESQWIRARQIVSKKKKPLILIFDEIQKVKNWSEIVKGLADEDKRKKIKIIPLLLGSSALLLQHGLSESLAGRFLLHRFTHWNLQECQKAFGWDLETWLFFGGYPGGAKFYQEEPLWQNYITDSLIETAITRDVFQLQKITKPTLLRHLFAFASQYPAQIFSYNKMLGQLQDAGNTTTLSHYLKLLETAFLVSGLEQFKLGIKQKRGSSPKLIMWNNALVNALSGKQFVESKRDPAWQGRLVENAVGAHLLNHLRGVRYQITYWRKKNDEVDFVVQIGNKIWAIEVKSGRPSKPHGLQVFQTLYPDSQPLLVGTGGMALQEFFSLNPQSIFR